MQSLSVAVKDNARRDAWALWSWLAVGAAGMLWLAAAMPPDGFFAGDSGVKLIAARNAVNHPGRPFEIDLPAIAGQRRPYVERFFQVHGDHAHATQSPVFPVLSAPPLASAGLRGVYLLPLISFLSVLPVLSLARGAMGVPIGVNVLGATTILTSPVFFYGLEFWEHAPAVACLAGSTALVLTAPRGRLASTFSAAAAGALGGLAVLLRPEAAWYLAGLVLLWRRERRIWFLVLGTVAVVGPFAVLNLVHSGNPLGTHAAVVLSSLTTTGWLGTRGDRLLLWLLPHGPLGVAGFATLAAAWLMPVADGDLRRRQTIGLIGSAVLALAAARGEFNRESAWAAWPVGALLFIPLARPPQMRRLVALSAVSIVAVVLTSPNDGGAQWGPRFLLFATPALLLLGAYAATDAVQPGHGRRIRVALVLVVLAAGLWTTRSAYRELRSAKRYYSGIVAAVETATSPGDYIVFSTWWFDQVVASLTGTRTFLYARDASAATGILRELETAGASTVTLAWSREGDGDPLDGSMTGTCFHVEKTHTLAARSLTLVTATCSSRR